ncbi:FAD binding domain-containing protein [Candidatus Poriferisocius sp.]|uniref:FAD binding domain-containing protein n=1 Tax=Candidatus Poriferisocius sp. TaxID=3101276 RepID=UPI003B521261
MKPPDFDYVAPTSIDDAVKALGSDTEAKVLAGGQSLIPLLAFRLAGPSLLVDLARVDGLDHITDEGDRLVIGAMTRQRRAERDPMVANRCPLLVESLRHVGHPQIRSRGTIGGSVAHADPAGELPAVVLALGGRVQVTGPAGDRTIEAEELFQGFLSTAIADDEILTAVELPASGPRTGWSVVEIARRPGDYALCGALCQLEIGDDGAVVDAHLALIGVGDRPMRAHGVEAAVLGGASSTEAAALAPDGLSPGSDVHASSDYRLHLATVTSRRALTQALERAV